MTDTPLSDELLARVGEAAENACLSEMSWPEIGSAALEAARYGEMEQRVHELEGTVDTAAKTFRRYAELHRMKGTTEGNLKASNNDDLAEFCESALLSSIGASHE